MGEFIDNLPSWTDLLLAVVFIVAWLWSRRLDRTARQAGEKIAATAKAPRWMED